jgi:GNAT superfamily N-acetyltransferase
VEHEVREALSDGEIEATFPIMKQLRPYLNEGEYLEKVRRMQGTGYRIAAVVEDGHVVCVAGFRIQEYLYCGTHLYVDDLVTDSRSRSRAHGQRMLDWLGDEARRHGCGELHLDSGLQRFDAHRFYSREGFTIFAYHFRKEL